MAIVHDVHARWRVRERSEARKTFHCFLFRGTSRETFLQRLFTHTDMVNTSLFYIL